jgi:NAD-dependent deacetylase
VVDHDIQRAVCQGSAQTINKENIMKQRQRIAVLSGAGISAESGIQTYRDSIDGLWHKHDPLDVASIDAWRTNPALVLEFHNARREELKTVQPNAAHLAIAELEQAYDVTVVTQNVDDLHERAGSSNVVHLHGQFTRSCEEHDTSVTYPYDAPLRLGDLGPTGRQLRPAVVWFGEQVPLFPMAQKIVAEADIFIVVGTSLNVYPAAGLIFDALWAKRKFLVNKEFALENLPFERAGEFEDWWRFIGPATEGMPRVAGGQR